MFTYWSNSFVHIITLMILQHLRCCKYVKKCRFFFRKHCVKYATSAFHSITLYHCQMFRCRPGLFGLNLVNVFRKYLFCHINAIYLAIGILSWLSCYWEVPISSQFVYYHTLQETHSTHANNNIWSIWKRTNVLTYHDVFLCICRLIKCCYDQYMAIATRCPVRDYVLQLW